MKNGIKRIKTSLNPSHTYKVIKIIYKNISISLILFIYYPGLQGQVPKIDTLSRFPSVFDDESQVKHPVLVVSEQVRHEK
jgi:hypothetical protein